MVGTPSMSRSILLPLSPTPHETYLHIYIKKTRVIKKLITGLKITTEKKIIWLMGSTSLMRKNSKLQEVLQGNKYELNIILEFMLDNWMATHYIINILTPSHPSYNAYHGTQMAQNQNNTNFINVLCCVVPSYIALL